MANADLDKQPDSVSSVLKVFGILQALGGLHAGRPISVGDKSQPRHSKCSGETWSRRGRDKNFAHP